MGKILLVQFVGIYIFSTKYLIFLWMPKYLYNILFLRHGCITKEMFWHGVRHYQGVNSFTQLLAIAM